MGLAADSKGSTSCRAGQCARCPPLHASAIRPQLREGLGTGSPGWVPPALAVPNILGGCRVPSTTALWCRAGSRGACGVQRGWGSACPAQPGGAVVHLLPLQQHRAGPVDQGTSSCPCRELGPSCPSKWECFVPPSGAPQPGWRSKPGGARRSAGWGAAAPACPRGVGPLGVQGDGHRGDPGQELCLVPAAALPGRVCAARSVE